MRYLCLIYTEERSRPAPPTPPLPLGEGWGEGVTRVLGAAPASDPRSAVEAVFRLESGRIIATLARQVDDLGLAEEAVQDAFAAALESWPAGGVPAAPG